MHDRRTATAVLAGVASLAGAAGCAPRARPFVFMPEYLLPRAVHSRPWFPAAEPHVFNSSDLEEYLDGGARPYLEYGMLELIHAIYARSGPPVRKMTVDVYEMSSPLAAYGIYSIQRPEAAEAVGLGASGFWSPGLLCFVKGRVFVAIRPPGEEASDMVSAMLIGSYINDRITLPAELPAMIDALPQEDRVRNSVKYLAENMLGHQFLGGGWVATYRYRGVTHELFVIPCADERQAIDRYEKLGGFVSKNGQVIRRFKDIGRAAMVGNAESMGRVYVVCSGKLLVGTIDCFDDERSARLAREVIEKASTIPL
jgi:hypothetical protein